MGTDVTAEEQKVQHQMLRSTSIVGGATVAGLAIGLVRMKVIAALMGPAGVGLLGMLNALQTMGTSIAGLGLDTSAVRQLSGTEAEPDRNRIARRAVWTLAWPLAIAGALVMWLFRHELATLALGNPDHAAWVGWIAVGVALGILGIVQVAVVQSYRRIGDLARIRLWSALIAAIASVAAIYWWGMAGIVVAVLATPAATLVAGWWYGRRLPAPPRGTIPGQAMLGEWRILVGLGLTVVLTTAIGSITQSAVRAVLADQLGLSAAGLYQASYAISSLNLGIVLGAMVPEYYPRLSAVADDRAAVSTLMNQQVHVGLILAAPALLAIAAGAPIVITLLYTSEFTGAALLLRLQVAADALRVIGWAIGFVLLARHARIAYVLMEAVLAAVFLPMTWLLAPRFGVAAAGASYLIGYAVALTVAICAARFAHGVVLSRSNTLGIAALLLLLLGIAGISHVSEVLALIVGAVACLAVGYRSLLEMSRIGFSVLPAWLMKIVTSRGGNER